MAPAGPRVLRVSPGKEMPVMAKDKCGYEHPVERIIKNAGKDDGKGK